MHKVVSTAAKIILLLLAVFIFTKIGLYKHALHKQKDAITKIITEPKNLSTNSLSDTEVLERLNDLIAIPLVGFLYV